MIAQAQSGTGKTATFLLAMLSRLDPEFHRCQCLCMAPTRELAVQIANVGRTMSRYIPGIRFSLAVRDENRKFCFQRIVKASVRLVLFHGYQLKCIDIYFNYVYPSDPAFGNLHLTGSMLKHSQSSVSFMS